MSDNFGSLKPSLCSLQNTSNCLSSLDKIYTEKMACNDKQGKSRITEGNGCIKPLSLFMLSLKLYAIKTHKPCKPSYRIRRTVLN